MSLLEESKVDVLAERDASIATIIKLRILARQQQLLRADFEEPPTKEILLAGLSRFEEQVQDVSVVLLSDYAKGGLTHVSRMIEIAQEHGKSVLIDPKGADWERYRGASLITPNRAELREVIGQWRTEGELRGRVQQLREQFALKALLLTRSEEGMTLYSDDGELHVAARAREVFDVSGAGDTVIATVAAMIGAGVPLPNAVEYANRAAGVVVGRIGTSPISYNELFATEA
ncbi:hypothetical protein WI69_23690 [Burkholderia diffusa]|nr:hypothetical protein WI28_18830 [Burkholderia diffusa]KVC13106.1 hypothetical protein WI69_23690 [Burkholderia diffusa]